MRSARRMKSRAWSAGRGAGRGRARRHELRLTGHTQPFRQAACRHPTAPHLTGAWAARAPASGCECRWPPCVPGKQAGRQDEMLLEDTEVSTAALNQSARNAPRSALPRYSLALCLKGRRPHQKLVGQHPHAPSVCGQAVSGAHPLRPPSHAADSRGCLASRQRRRTTIRQAHNLRMAGFDVRFKCVVCITPAGVLRSTFQAPVTPPAPPPAPLAACSPACPPATSASPASC